MSKKRNTKFKWIVTGMIAVVVVAVAMTALMKPAPLAYESVVAKTGDITTYYSFSGNVETKDRQTVTADKMMQISEIKVKEGDLVEEGTVLIKTTSGEEIKAKVRGEVVHLNVDEKAQVMAGTQLLEVVDYDNLEIQVKVDEYDIASLDQGKEASIKIGAINKEIKGKIRSISKEGQIINGVTFFTATIDLEKAENIRVGMSAEVKVVSNEVKGVITLPMTAIQFDENNKPYVFKNGEKDTVVKADIETGINDGTTVEVKSGLVSEEKILYKKAAATTGMDFSRGGMNGAGGEE
ncbi:MAG TPA: HlyD family efflux transporter periplasmic adaptor subunit [Desulfitobacterium dehalogenans]|uniref:HlyD family efflux transporter periplasmic adaptor subunit n=1 Tax=Desulfitobacterium dehalogenans TaxID=36854 RepID=A0A7C6Z2C2_9FIRM|nr:HlyD family efflux transporter periplasmic adaptor subunit [Desulfitobacterium dehalogenans]